MNRTKRFLRKVMSASLAFLMTVGMMPMTAMASEPGQNVDQNLVLNATGINYSFSANENVNFNGGTSHLSFEVMDGANMVDGVSNDHVQIDDNTRQVNGSIGFPENAQYTRFTVLFQGGQSFESASIKINGTEKLDSSAIEQLGREEKLEFFATANDLVEVSIVLTTNNGQQPGPDGGEGGQPGGPRADAVIHLAGCGNGADVWTGVPMVDDYNGATTFDFNETWKGVPEGDHRRGGLNVNIIGTDNWTDSWYRGYEDQERQGYLNFTVDGVNPGQGDRYIVVATQWSETIDAIRVNNVDYSDQLITATTPMDQYFAHFGGQMIYSVIKVPAPALSTVDNKEVEVYEVEAAVRPITSDECRVGNFRWSSDDKMSNTDTYVGNAIMELQSITYNGQTYTDIANCPWVGDYSPNHEDFGTGAMMGDMFVPAGAEVTMRITPYYGYQVQSFKLSGGQFTAEDEPGVFTFTVGKGNFHLGGKTIEVADKVEATATSVSEVAASFAPGGEFTKGSGELTISNANPSDDKKTEFTTAAGEQEVDLIGGDGAYLAIDFNQVIYKANSQENPDKENEVWTQEVHDLGGGFVAITMKFPKDVDVSTVVLFHNIGDGDEFEVIRPDSYDVEENTATFRVKSFSTFAIAQAHTKTVPVTPSNTNTNTNGGSSAPAATTVDTVPKTAETFPIVPVMVVAIVSFATMAVVVFERKRRA